MIALHADAGIGAFAPLAALLPAASAYGLGVARLRRRGDRWSLLRTAALATGLVVLAMALVPPLATRTDHFQGHVAQHLLISGVAPLLLALGAPVTLAVRALPVTGRRWLLTVLHSRPVRILTSPPVIIAVVVAPMFALYLTGWYAAASGHPVWHPIMHAHLVAAGLLSTSYLLGLEPMPRRASVVERLLVLVVIAGSHHLLAKLMYALERPLGAGTQAELQAGAQWMYYGGDVIEVALAVIIGVRWYREGGRELRRSKARAGLTVRGGAVGPAVR